LGVACRRAGGPPAGSDLGRAQAWYADKLALTPDQQEPQALLYRSGADRLFLLFSSAGAGTAHHQLGAWLVEDLAAEVAQLRSRGVVFEEYDQSGLRTVDGIAATPPSPSSAERPAERRAAAVTDDAGTASGTTPAVSHVGRCPPILGLAPSRQGPPKPD
jgi:hypothetical protein